MAHIDLGLDETQLPGITGLLTYRSETGAVQVSGRNVTPELIGAARDAGASDLKLHDTVLIAAAFCMYNRYVDGLGTLAPADPAMYARAAERIVQFGYRR
ncbi:MAG: hypothetical protein ABI047_06760 [Jatrophihabitantaceae bacterium]